MAHFACRFTAARLAAAALALSLAAGASSAELQDLTELSLEELSNTRVTSVSKRAEPIADAAASVFVISSDDLRRAGVNTLPEAQRPKVAAVFTAAELAATPLVDDGRDHEVEVRVGPGTPAPGGAAA